MAAILAVACGKQETQAPTPAPECKTGISCKTGVDEKQAGAIYAKYKYQEVGQCSDGSLRHTWLVLADRIVVAKTTDGKDIVADMQVFLYDDGSYTGTYQELTQERGDMGFWKTVSTANQKALAGTWAIQQSQIMIEQFGLGDNVNARGWPGIQFTLAKDNSINPVLGEKQINLITTRSKTSKDGKSVDAICAERK